MKFIGAQLGVGEIGVGSFRQPAVAKRREAKLIAKAGSTRMAGSRPRPSRTIFREGPLLARSRHSLNDVGVFVEMDALGTEGRRILNAGLADGLESVTERPPAITAF